MRYSPGVGGSRQRAIWVAAITVVVAWGLAMAGYRAAQRSRMTAEKGRAYAQSLHLEKLSGEARARALRELADRINRLSPEERRRAHLERVWEGLFKEMTEEEKGMFIEATMPTGFKQMLVSFEQLPEERRRHAITDALRRLKEDQERAQDDGAGPGPGGSTNGPALG